MPFEKYADAESHEVLPKETQEELATLLRDKENVDREMVKQAYVTRSDEE